MHNIILGNNMKSNECPILSDGVFIGAGAKIIGDVFLAKEVRVGANVVVTKSVLEENVTVLWIAGKIIHKRE